MHIRVLFNPSIFTDLSYLPKPKFDPWLLKQSAPKVTIYPNMTFFLFVSTQQVAALVFRIDKPFLSEQCEVEEAGERLPSRIQT